MSPDRVSYGRLSTEIYDFDTGFADESEVAFFEAHIKEAGGPVLEAMCGSGRLLIPLLQKGLKVEGVDNSQEMLEKLEFRCGKIGVATPPTHLQSVTSLKLEQKYSLIFIAMGSFQLLSALQRQVALKRFHASLGAGGKLLMDTFIPWDLIDSPKNFSVARRQVRTRAHLVHIETEILVDRSRSQYTKRCHYEVRKENGEVEIEEDIQSVQWLFPEQMISELKAAGFCATYQAVPFGSEKPRRYIYEASLIT